MPSEAFTPRRETGRGRRIGAAFIYSVRCLVLFLSFSCMALFYVEGGGGGGKYGYLRAFGVVVPLLL